MSDMTPILVRQDATARARQRMQDMLIGFEPAHKLTVGDVRWIADWVSTITFDAIKDVDDKEGR